MFRRKKSERLELSERIKEVTEKNAQVLAQLQQAKLNLTADVSIFTSIHVGK